MSASGRRELHFSVDSALLKELGERLVGRPHIALSELVKNSYDADASVVIIRFEGERITIEDDGTGMTFEQFRDFWMRIGSPHKQDQRTSPKLKRPLTGSKGVGRLSVQFLAKNLLLQTASVDQTSSELTATVDWREAVSAGDLTEARALYDESSRQERYADGSAHGTRLVLDELNHEWGPTEFQELAGELWPLQPPFSAFTEGGTTPTQDFEVRIETPHPEISQRFEEQMGAVLDIWHARLRGTLKKAAQDEDGEITLVLKFSDGRSRSVKYPAGDALNHLEFEIRVFHLSHRQPKGIRVDEARRYLNRYGGVHVYDAGFHLPYYGSEADWLRIEIDHSHRISRSQLLPAQFQIEEGLSFLPTNSRLFGVVQVNTTKERERSDDRASLQIQISRDRLVDNAAFRELQRLVRWSLDFYAMEEARRALGREVPRSKEPLEKKVARLDRVLSKYKENLPEELFETLSRDVKAVVQDVTTEELRLSRSAGLLGALATAGIGALAYEHEVNKQFHLLEGIADGLIESPMDEAGAEKAARQIQRWITRARSTRRLFSPLLDEENRERVERFVVRQVTEDVVLQLKPFMRGVEVRKSGLPDNWRLPPGRYVEWSAMFQNVVVNAVNAMREKDTKRLTFTAEEDRGIRSILIHDTGVGVDPTNSDELFEPFVRKLDIPQERRVLGLGGSGLGLTIVRMIAGNLGVKATFVSPPRGYRASFRIAWKEPDG